MPTVSVVVTRDDETLVERAWGFADVSIGRKAEPSTIYQVASLNKHFTAALAPKLVDRGRLSLGASPFADRRPPRITGSSHPRNGIA
jgi:CubicO group peptidase (beta-lactamase class C family)